MLDAAVQAGATVVYGKKLVAVREDDGEATDDYEDEDDKALPGAGNGGVVARFEDGTEARGDVLFGCDGIHSAVRTSYVEAARQPTYTGISSACGYAAADKVTSPVHFTEMGMNMSGRGSLLTTYSDREKKSVFLAAVMEVEEEGRDGWQARGKVVDEARGELLRRFESPSLPCVGEMMAAVEELFYYPVFTLSNGGTWYKGRAMLVGDAAHAVCPFLNHWL